MLSAPGIGFSATRISINGLSRISHGREGPCLYCRFNHVAESTNYRYLKQARHKASSGTVLHAQRFLPVRTASLSEDDASASRLAFPNGCRLLLSELTAESLRIPKPFLVEDA